MVFGIVLNKGVAMTLDAVPNGGFAWVTATIGFHCVMCISFWVSLGAAFLVNGFVPWTLSYGLAVAGAVVVIHRRAL